MKMALLFSAFWLFASIQIAAQAPDKSAASDAATPQGSFPEATFDATFRKHTPPANAFSPFYSWDAHMALNLTAYRGGPHAADVSAFFQSIGTENLGSKVSVGGTGYLLGFGYVHSRSDRFKLSAGYRHLSSHLTRDLDDKLEEEHNNKGNTVPVVEDPSEYNVIYVGGSWKLPSVRFAPELDVILQPINFTFNGSPAGDVRPLYLATKWTLWRGEQKSIAAETRQEFGANPVNNFSVVLKLFARNQSEGRLQVFLSGTPGGSLHVSPNFGALRGGFAVGVRLHFRA